MYCRVIPDSVVSGSGEVRIIMPDPDSHLELVDPDLFYINIREMVKSSQIHT